MAGVHQAGKVKNSWVTTCCNPQGTHEIKRHSSTLIALGTFLMWFGFYGFNSGSTLMLTNPNAARDMARVAVTTTLAPASCVISVILLKRYFDHCWDMSATCNGILGGLVMSCACASTIDPWVAIVLGFCNGFVYFGASKVLVMARIDDPLDAFPVHGACGIFGTLMTGFVASPKYSTNLSGDFGVLYGGNGTLLSAQLTAICAVVLWVGACSFVLFSSLKYLGLLRISVDVEEEGMDVSCKHGGSAYGGRLWFAGKTRPGPATFGVVKKQEFGLQGTTINSG